MRTYKIDAAINGKMLVPDVKDPLDLDITFTFKLQQKFGKRETDGMMPLDINMLEGQITSQGQKLDVAGNLYPQLTALLDKNWRINDIFGASDSQLTQKLPGINYGNMTMLFFLQGADQPHAVGDSWNTKVKIPSAGESYSFVNTIKGVQEIDGVKAALVDQQISRDSKAMPGPPTRP